MAPLAEIGQAEVAATAGRAAEIDRQERVSLLDQQLTERLEVAEDPGRGTAVRVDDGRDGPPAALPGGAGGAPEGDRDRQPVARPDLQALGRDEAARRARRPAASGSGAAAGHGSRRRREPGGSRSPPGRARTSRWRGSRCRRAASRPPARPRRTGRSGPRVPGSPPRDVASAAGPGRGGRARRPRRVPRPGRRARRGAPGARTACRPATGGAPCRSRRGSRRGRRSRT